MLFRQKNLESGKRLANLADCARKIKEMPPRRKRGGLWENILKDGSEGFYFIKLHTARVLFDAV